MTDTRPIWRVNRHPRFTILEIGAYMAADDGPRETIARDLKYERIARSLTYRILNQAAGNYLLSPLKDHVILHKCRALLEAEKAAATNPKVKEQYTYQLRALDAFEASLNALGLRDVHFEKWSQDNGLEIEGVKVSVYPTARIRASRPRAKHDLIGALVLDTAKGQSLKSKDGEDRANKAMLHSAAILHDHVSRGIGDGEKASNEHSIVFHTFRPHKVTAPGNYKRLLRNVEAVCRNVRDNWDAIKPPPGFDADRATYRST